MYQGKPIQGLEFYHLIYNNSEFTKELGKLTLAAGRLEAELAVYLKKKGLNQNLTGKTLGQLIRIGKKNALLDSNLLTHLEILSKQRNYLIHNIYALFAELIDETVIGRNQLIDTDVLSFIEKAWQLNINLCDLTESLYDD